MLILEQKEKIILYSIWDYKHNEGKSQLMYAIDFL